MRTGFQIIAVLQVLTFRDTVRCDQHINFGGAARHQNIPTFGNRGKAGQHIIQCCLKSFDRCFSINGAGDDRCIQSIVLLDILADMVVQILGRIRKRREDQDFLILVIDGMLDFLRQQL